MLICGIKASHDGGIALVDNGRLLASIEVEKLANGARYSSLGRLARVGEILRSEGVDPDDVDRFVVDGWWPAAGAPVPSVKVVDETGADLLLPVAPYVDGGAVRDPLRRYDFGPARFAADRDPFAYRSYHHASNHMMGAYCTSPFARRGEDALVVVWDGGIIARAYQVDAAARKAVPVRQLFPIVGNIFPDFCAHFGPFRRDTSAMSGDEEMRNHLEIAGKAMAYAALGTPAEDAFEVFDTLFGQFPGIDMDNADRLGQKVAANRDELLPGLSDADIVATLQAYLGRKLQTSLTRLVWARYRDAPPNLCLGGGCALNIKWNSRLRETGLFRDLWVAPFPNDSGAAIGTACCEMFAQSDISALDWDVYRGPVLTASEPPAGWTARPCDEVGLAALLHTEGEPVVVLSGRAELGPRALGNRSIIAPAVDPRMKERLNALKARASYRPVAPICLASRAPQVFSPGTRDPYMLFEHTVRPEWTDRVPAIMHLDGTARLQTVDETTRSPIVTILTEYERLSGVPVLCNTSANLNGHGFFPDLRTAAQWGRTRYIWSEGTLYTRSTSDPAD